VARIRRELRDPRFGEYHLCERSGGEEGVERAREGEGAKRAARSPSTPQPHSPLPPPVFTNRLDDVRLQDLAEADARERVFGVTEAFGDFVPLSPRHFAVPPLRPAALLAPAAWDYAASTDALTRVTEGVASVLLSLRRRFQVRHAAGSEPAARLAAALHHLADVDERALFDFGGRAGEGPPLLLVLDRRDDPVTPLLSQWTYEAMAHELLGITDGCVDLSRAPGVGPAFRDIVLTAAADPFFAAHARSNFGDVGVAVRGLVDDVARSTAGARGMATVAAMRAFVESVPDVTAAQAAAGKHVSLLGELARLVDARGLMALSALEQELACGSGSAAAHADAVATALADARAADGDRLRLAALFALRHERDGATAIADFERRLLDYGLPPRGVGALRTLLRRAGAAARSGDLYSDRTLAARLAATAKASLRGVENVYTRHTPPLVATVGDALRGRLSPVDFPTSPASPAQPSAPPPLPPKLVVVFIMGGTTHEEAAAVEELNDACARGDGPAPGARVVLGGTGVLNSASFFRLLEEVGDAERVHGGG